MKKFIDRMDVAVASATKEKEKEEKAGLGKKRGVLGGIVRKVTGGSGGVPIVSSGGTGTGTGTSDKQEEEQEVEGLQVDFYLVIVSFE